MSEVRATVSAWRIPRSVSFAFPSSPATRRRIAELEAALGEALDLAHEGWEYADDYFREKWRANEREAELRKLVKP